MLPLLAAANLAFSVLVRRRFGLFSGVYDVLLGLLASLVFYSGLGIPASLPKFLPEVVASAGPAQLRRFVRQASAIRFVLLGLLLIPLNVFATPVAQALDLGPDGALYIGLLSGLVVTRAVLDLAFRTLNAFFAQFWSNLFALMQAMLDVVLVGFVLLLGYEMAGVLGSLLASAGVMAVVSAGYVWLRFDRLSSRDVAATGTGASPSSDGSRWLAGHGTRFVRFSLFTYAIGLLSFFTDMGFAAPALALTLATEGVALFATAYKLSFMTITLGLGGFRGLYQPVFARLRIRHDPGQLRRAFSIVTRGQLVVLLPAGMGLLVMCGDYIPLLFGTEFRPAIPVARVLVAFMYVTAVFNIPGIILMVDEQYRSAFWAQSIPAVAAPVFLLAAASSGLLAAAVVFGGARLGTAIVAYAMCRRRYGLTFPWVFAARIGAISLAMATTLGLVRSWWATTPVEAVTLTVLGVVLVCLGLRWTHALGPDEVGLLRRSGLPGHTWLLGLLCRRVRDLNPEP